MLHGVVIAYGVATAILVIATGVGPLLMIEKGRVPMEPTGMELNERDVVEMVVLEFKRDWFGEYLGPVIGSPS